jgi:hypothetical protein
MGKSGKKNEAGNILKTKGRERGFRKNEAENILKTKQLTQHRGDSKKAENILKTKQLTKHRGNSPKDLTICPWEGTQNRPS